MEYLGAVVALDFVRRIVYRLDSPKPPSQNIYQFKQGEQAVRNVQFGVQ